jgi:hypothetical protein
MDELEAERSGRKGEARTLWNATVRSEEWPEKVLVVPEHRSLPNYQ